LRSCNSSFRLEIWLRRFSTISFLGAISLKTKELLAEVKEKELLAEVNGEEKSKEGLLSLLEAKTEAASASKSISLKEGKDFGPSEVKVKGLNSDVFFFFLLIN